MFIGVLISVLTLFDVVIFTVSFCQTAWFINLIVVEEPIFEAFVATLKMRIDRFADYQNEHESLFQYGEYIKEKTRDGYEVRNSFMTSFTLLLF